MLADATMHRAEAGELFGPLRANHVPGEAPAPTAGFAGLIHTVLAAEPEQILHEIDGRVCDGARGRADHGPMEVALAPASTAKVLAGEIALVFGSVLIPALGGVIVVGPCVDYTVADIIVGQERMIGAAAERELHDLHTRQTKLIAE